MKGFGVLCIAIVTVCAFQSVNGDIEEHCTRGEFKMDDCNSCSCINLQGEKTGWACTKMACNTKPRERRDVSCTPCDQKKKDCNIYTCTKAQDSGTVWLCTRIGCNVHIAFLDQPLEPVPADGKCVPGRSYKQDCNTCFCTEDGEIGGCTEKVCPPKSKRQAQLEPVPADGKCTPGVTYQQDCNTCKCNNEGEIGACTYALCPSKSKRQAEFEPVPADGNCTPGVTYQQDCNTCTCNTEGKIGACTLALCPSRPKPLTQPLLY